MPGEGRLIFFDDICDLQVLPADAPSACVVGRSLIATHQNLEQRVCKGLLREDLYHHLNMIRLCLLSLRERIEDILILMCHFLALSARKLGVEVSTCRMWCDLVPEQPRTAGHFLPENLYN